VFGSGYGRIKIAVRSKYKEVETIRTVAENREQNIK
jgi:hypothetical protein